MALVVISIAGLAAIGSSAPAVASAPPANSAVGPTDSPPPPTAQPWSGTISYSIQSHSGGSTNPYDSGWSATVALNDNGGTVAMFPDDQGADNVDETASLVSGQGLEEGSATFPLKGDEICTETTNISESNFDVDTPENENYVALAVVYHQGIAFPTFPRITDTVAETNTFSPAECGQNESSTANSYINAFGAAGCGEGDGSVNGFYPVNDYSHIVGSCESLTHDATDTSGTDFSDVKMSWDLTLSPTADSDGDGCTDVVELAAGTSPVDSTSAPANCSEADLALDVADPAPMADGSPTHFTSTVTNNGPQDAEGTTLNFSFTGVPPVTVSDVLQHVRILGAGS